MPCQKRELFFVEPVNGERYWDNLYNLNTCYLLAETSHSELAHRACNSQHSACTYCSANVNFVFPELCPNGLEVNLVDYMYNI